MIQSEIPQREWEEYVNARDVMTSLSAVNHPEPLTVDDWIKWHAADGIVQNCEYQYDKEALRERYNASLEPST